MSGKLKVRSDIDRALIELSLGAALNAFREVYTRGAYQAWKRAVSAASRKPSELATEKANAAERRWHDECDRSVELFYALYRVPGMDDLREMVATLGRVADEATTQKAREFLDTFGASSLERFRRRGIHEAEMAELVELYGEDAQAVAEAVLDEVERQAS